MTVSLGMRRRSSPGQWQTNPPGVSRRGLTSNRCISFLGQQAMPTSTKTQKAKNLSSSTAISRIASFQSKLTLEHRFSRKVSSRLSDSLLECFILNDTSDVMSIPKWWAACTVANNIVFWKEHSSGGHFPSVEKPDELVQDIRDFTNMFNGSKMRELTKAGS
jgi:hypothetical protein